MTYNVFGGKLNLTQSMNQINDDDDDDDESRTGVGRCAREKSSYRRVCYYTNWAQYRTAYGKFQPQNIPLQLCTHLVYAFASMNGNRLTPFEWNDETAPWMRGMYVDCKHWRSQGVQWVHLQPFSRGGEKNIGVIHIENL